MIPKFLLVMVVVFCSNAALGQSAEVAFTVGATLPTHAHEPSVCPTCPPFDLPVASGVAVEGNFAARLADLKAVSVYFEFPVVGVPSREAGFTFSSIFFTPSARVKFLPHEAVSPFASAGGGGVHYGGALAHVGTNNTTWAAQFGGGADIKTSLPRVAFRAEVRDFLTGMAGPIPIAPKTAKLNNVIISGGVVFKF